MSTEQDKGRGIPQKIVDWLNSLTGKQQSPEEHEPAQHLQIAESELLERAARCYALACWDEDACRIFEQVQDDRHAAPYHERLGRLPQAAQCYARAADWHNAARCFRECAQFEQAAECLLKAGDSLSAAWILADHVHRFRQAESVVRRVKPETETDNLTVDLVLARCEAGTGLTSEAAKRVRRVLSRLGSLKPDIHSRRLKDWASIVAENLRRPDIIALLHAASLSAGTHNAQEQWETWAEKVLEDVTGIPQDVTK